MPATMPFQYKIAEGYESNPVENKIGLKEHLEEIYQDPARRAEPQYILFKLGERADWIKLDLSQDPFEFWCAEVNGRPTLAKMKQIIADFVLQHANEPMRDEQYHDRYHAEKLIQGFVHNEIKTLIRNEDAPIGWLVSQKRNLEKVAVMQSQPAIPQTILSERQPKSFLNMFGLFKGQHQQAKQSHLGHAKEQVVENQSVKKPSGHK